MTISQHHRDILQAMIDDKFIELQSSNGKWVALSYQDAYKFLYDGLIERIRIKPEPKRLYGKMGDDRYIAFGSSMKGDTHYIDILDGDIVGFGKVEK